MEQEEEEVRRLESTREKKKSLSFQGTSVSKFGLGMFRGRTLFVWNESRARLLIYYKVVNVLQAHAKLLKLGFHTDRFANNTLITFYSTFALVDSARKMFDEMTVRDRDTTLWNSMIDGYVANGQGWNSLACFREMHGKPDRIAVTSALAACSLEMCKRLRTENSLLRG